jgi:hypothetical protein
VHLDHALPVIRWKLEKENTTQNLIGHAWVNGSDHEASAQALHIEFHDPSSGRFAVGSDEDTLRPLFSFAFQQVKGSVPMAAGKYLGAETQGDEGGAVYLFQASSPDRFTLTVTPRSFDLARAAKQPKVEAQQAKKAASEDEDDLMQSSGPASTGHPILTPEDLASFHGESFVYVGHRVKSEPEKSFFQKWGTMVMLAGMLVLNVYMRSRNVGGAGAAAAVASPRAAAARVAGGSSKKGGATVEEITEGEGAKKDK